MNKVDIQKKLLLLQETFFKRLPQKIDRIADAWFAFKKENTEENTLHLIQLVHSFKGTTGTYGYSELTKKAAKFESQLEAFINTPPSDESLRLADKAFEQLKQIALRSEPVATSLLEDLHKPLPESKKLIYLIDSDEVFMKKTAKELESFQYNVACFTNLDTLSQTMQQKKPFALIIDESFMYQQQDKIKHLIQDNHCYLFIMTTENGDFENHLAAVRLGAQYYLNKPFSIEEVIDVFDQFIQKNQAHFNILIVEDVEEIAQYYAILLQQAGMKPHILTKPKLIYETLIKLHPDLILMDIYMPECNGLELAAMIRQHHKYTSTPIIFLSSEEKREKQLKAMSLGVDDFITKSTKPEFVLTTIKNCVERYRNLNAIITKDSLTGVLNHSSIQERLLEAIKMAHRLHSSLAVALIDLDDFKRVNDEYGHLKGDQVLKNLCLLLRKRLRETDIVGRYGGEEFLILFPNTNAQQAKKALDKVREAFVHFAYHHEGKTFHVSFSAGIAQYPEANSHNKLIKIADQLLYQAKKEGKNVIVTN